MIELILITAVLRTQNLFYILENLKTVLIPYKDKIEPMWALCFDKYNADINQDVVKKITKSCVDAGIRISIYYQGEKDKENYGGALFNLPLQDLKNHNYQTSDPFIYILDDDNILSTSFPKYLISISTDYSHQIWWTNMVDEHGSQYFSRNADALAFRNGKPGTVNENYRIIHPCASLDPSGMITKLNFVLSTGGFASRRDYDYAFMNKIYYDSNFENMISFQGDDPWLRNGRFYSSTTYHNALVKRSDIDETIADIKPDTPEDSYIKVHVGENHYYIIPLNNKQLKEILKIARNYKI